MDFAAYVFYVNRSDLLYRALSSFETGCTTIVDNSESHDVQDSRIFLPPVPLSYAQSMNWMLKDALKKEVDFIIHFHSDAYSDNPNALEELLERVRGFGDRKWACAWTHYDLLWAINPVALRDIGGWDTMFPTYFGDNDARRRWELAGWECINTDIQGVQHEGSATINSDLRLKFLTAQIFPLHAQLYRQKWGGEPGKEIFTKPWSS